MTNEELQAHILAIKSACEAGIVEFNGPYFEAHGEFHKCTGVFGPYHYRIKPKPREVWITKESLEYCGLSSAVIPAAYPSPEAARRSSMSPIPPMVRFREVID